MCIYIYMCVYLYGRFYASVITRELGLNNNLPTDTYNNAGGLLQMISLIKT